ncbi:MAG: NAD-dependent epimerase/dehydratase family protein [Chloroflexi bacterium]|nr:NAD-dependent epimerase/dehydratase family protein [Chloroflexota bacterium]
MKVQSVNDQDHRSQEVAQAFAGRPVLVTGGASFIGSHLVDALVAAGARVRVVDDLSSGKLVNISRHVDSGAIEFVRADLLNPSVAADAVAGMRTVFHLAANHGGRGYVDLRQADCATNLLLDGGVFRACRLAGVEKVVYASSGCVYPNHLQTDPTKQLYLGEDRVGPPYDADNMYGWAKLMGELTLRALYQEHGLKSVSCRYFTVYGPRGHENQAVMAMIARAFIRQDPFEVWGSGRQVRNWTYVSDIVDGTLLAAAHIDDSRAVNLGARERIRVIDAVRQVLKVVGHRPEIRLRKDMPTGPMNRVADPSLAERLLNWTPRVRFEDGLRTAIDWYVNNHCPNDVAAHLAHRLTER